MFKANNRRPRRTIPFRHVFVVSCILFIGLSSWGLWFINAGIAPVLIDIAETRTKQIATYAITAAIGKKEIREMTDIMSQEDGDSNGSNQLIINNRDKNGEISSYTYNTVAINTFYNRITHDIQEFLRQMEEGEMPLHNPYLGGIKIERNEEGLFYYIPLGQATHNVLLSNLGPKIPVHFEVISNVVTSVGSKVTPLNINNNYVQLYVHVQVDVKIVIPFATKTASVESDIPIVEQFIKGDVPIYWSGAGSGGGSPSVVLPGQKLSKEDLQNLTPSKSSGDKKKN